VGDTDPRPAFELSPRPDTFQPHSKPSLHRPTAHDKGLHADSIGEVTRIGRIDSEQKATLATRGDGHVAVYEERQSAEHAKFAEALFTVENFAEAVGEDFVVGHGFEYPTTLRNDGPHARAAAHRFGTDGPAICGLARASRHRR
jgi:hypothetical protein